MKPDRSPSFILNTICEMCCFIGGIIFTAASKFEVYVKFPKLDNSNNM